MNIRTNLLNRYLESWLEEDLGRGDLTESCLKNEFVSAYWIAKEDGVFCGINLVEKIFKKLDNSISVQKLISDGENFKEGQILLRVKGPANSIAAAERTSLNLAMHLSGIATKTASLVKELIGTNIYLCDTRKTTPGLRIFEKYAFRCGGGKNHRFGLDDAAMIKENHIAWSNGIQNAIKSIRESGPWTARIIVEAESAEQATEAAEGGADGILLDEMSPEEIKSLIPILRESAERKNSTRKSNAIVIEASGVDPSQLKSYKGTGVDCISTSASVTKSKWIDLSMRFEKEANSSH